MNSPLLRNTVEELLRQRPARAKVLERLGIDFCCGGGKTLEQACNELSLDAAMVLEVLSAFDAKAAREEEPDCAAMSLTELVAHIEGTHHAYLKHDVPQLAAWVAKVGARHGDRDPRLTRLAEVFAHFYGNLHEHMRQEEQVLFPMIRCLEAGKPMAGGGFTSLQAAVRALLPDHDNAGDSMERMAELTDNFYAAPDACNTFRAMMDGLARLRRDMRVHLQKENGVLFPRALALEEQLTGHHTAV